MASPISFPLQEASRLLQTILSVNGPRDEANTLIPYNQLSICLDASMSEASLLSSVHPDANVRAAAEKCEQEASKFATELSLNRALYEALLQVDPVQLDADAKRMLEESLREFRRSGVDKDQVTRDKIAAVEEELVEIGQAFGRNIREDVRFIELDSAQELAGLPQDYIDSHMPDALGKIRITTDYPDYVPFMTYADSAQARRQLSKEYLTRGYPQNEAVLSALLQKRHALAKMLGYSSYADYSLEDKMMKSSSKVAEFIEEISEQARVAASYEYDALIAKKREYEPDATQVFGYERSYLEEKVKRESFAFDSQDVRPYFEYNRIKQGVLQVAGELFGIQFERIVDAETWHPDVDVYDVRDGKKVIGRIFLDMHPREDKFKHAALFSRRSGIKGLQLPEGVLVCNFADPKKTQPALMDHDQVVTFFHEFGHLMHHIFGGQQTWAMFSGIATEWDFVEAPSQLFEEWAWDASVLQRFAKHYRTNEPIPADLVKRMRAADEFGKALDTRQQMFYAAISLQYYLRDPHYFDIHVLMREMQQKYSQFPYLEGTYFNLSFGHLDDYSACYYTYMWSKVIAKDIFQIFTKNGLMDRATAQGYRETILGRGGSQDATTLIEQFLGRSLSFDAFRNWLAGNCGKGHQAVL